MQRLKKLKCHETQRYQTCNNSRKKELFGTRTDLFPTNFFFWKFISHRNKNNINTYEQTYLFVLSILEISEKVMSEFSFDCIKSKFTEKVKLCYRLQTALYFT